MLGGTRTGKTCYLVAMYGMMRKGTKGFTFSTPDLDEDLVLAQLWKKMRTTTGGDRWPPPTVETQDREFDFCHGYKPFRRFVWHDYRGGALHSPLTDPDAQKLADRLADSSCVMLCFSAAHLTDPAGRVAEDGVAAIEVTDDGDDEATRMNQLMSLVARKAQERGRPLPSVVVVLTKYDLIAAWPREAVLEKVRDMFGPLYARGNGWTVTTCPVSLGTDLAGDTDGGKVEAVNVHRPVAFAVYCSMRQSAAQAAAGLAARTASHGEAQKMGRLGRWWNNVDLTSRADAVSRSQAEVNELGRQLDILFRELVEGLKIYHNGEESEFND
jgi:hypothetical protein